MSGEQTRIRMLPPGWADLTRKHAGEKWRPSNGTEGDLFFAGWCCQCARDKALSEGVDFDECDDGELCEIIAATFRFKVDEEGYPAEWHYAPDGQPCCSAFVQKGEAIPPRRCEKTIDMFGGDNV